MEYSCHPNFIKKCNLYFWNLPMMSVMLDSSNSAPLSGYNASNHSGFNGALSAGGNLTGGVNFPSTKYFDTYTYSTSSTTYNRRILGDGTSEFGPFANATYGSYTRQRGSWYGDDGYTLTTSPWTSRGAACNFGIISGIFTFSYNYGLANTQTGFRVVLAI